MLAKKIRMKKIIKLRMKMNNFYDFYIIYIFLFYKN